MDYKATLNLPKTDFPMKANLPKREPECSALVGAIGHLRAAARRPRRAVRLDPPRRPAVRQRPHPLRPRPQQDPEGHRREVAHDGGLRRGLRAGLGLPRPADRAPGRQSSASTRPGVDVRARDGSGREAPALPRVRAASSSTSSARSSSGSACSATGSIPYLTLAPALRGGDRARARPRSRAAASSTRGMKPVHWCTHDKTALAEAEVEYEDQTSPSVYVRFPLVDAAAGALPRRRRRPSLVIWTTTPWTLPANLAIAVHPELRVRRARRGRGESLIVAASSPRRSPQATGVERRRAGSSRVRRPTALERRRVPSPVSSTATGAGGGWRRLRHAGRRHRARPHRARPRRGRLRARPRARPAHLPRSTTTGASSAEVEHFAGLTVCEANPRSSRTSPTRGALIAPGAVRAHATRTAGAARTRRSSAPRSSGSSRSTSRDCASARSTRSARRAVGPAVGRGPHLRHDREPPRLVLSRQRVWGVPIAAFYCDGLRRACCSTRR